MIAWALPPDALAAPPRLAPGAAAAVVLIARVDDPLWEAAAPRARPEDLADAAAARAADGGAGRLWRRRLARLLVGRVLGRAPASLELGRDPDGRPRLLAPAGLHLSASGRGPWSAAALAGRPVGVDLELAPPDPAARDAMRDFVRREAFAKALGLSLDAALEAPDDAVAAAVAAERGGADYVCALALDRGARPEAAADGAASRA